MSDSASNPGAGAVSGVIFNIQRYSIHDGPGIRTTVFLKGCPLRCTWCQNPESQRVQPELMLDRAACTLCGGCLLACREQANQILGGALTVDRAKCTGCGACAEACPADARKISGRVATVDEILDVVVKDRAMYEKSSGGLTVSGGDPVFQPEFTVALLKEAKKRGLHTAVETCGYTSWETLKEILEHTDHLLYDIKSVNERAHKIGTGVSNRRILENAKNAARLGHLTMQVRTPLIPGFNDSEEHIAQVADFVTGELGLPAGNLSLLKYNKYMEGKYESLDRGAQLIRLEPQSDEYFERLNAIIAGKT